MRPGGPAPERPGSACGAAPERRESKGRMARIGSFIGRRARAERPRSSFRAGADRAVLLASHAPVMDQRYIDTVRAMKVIIHNLDHLDTEVTYGQRRELERLVHRVREVLDGFLNAGEDEGLWVGEE
jgi:hypothetical protein